MTELSRQNHERITDRKSELKKFPTEVLLELKELALERLNEAELTIHDINEIIEERRHEEHNRT